MSFLGLKALLGNSRRSVNVVLVTAFCVTMIYGSFTMVEGFAYRASLMAEGYTVTDLYYLADPGASVSDAAIDPGLLAALPEGTPASPLVRVDAVLSHTDARLQVWGVDPVLFAELRGPRILGEHPGTGEAMAGQGFSRRYGVAADSVVTVECGGEAMDLLVTAVFTSNTFYDDCLLVDMETAWSLKGERGSYSLVEVKTRNPESISSLPALNSLGLSVVPSRTMQLYLKSVTGSIKDGLVLLSSLVAFLSFTIILHTLYKMTGESVGEFHIMRSVGLTGLQVQAHMVAAAIILCLAGAVLGLVFSLLFANGVSLAVYLVYKSIYVPTSFDASLALICIALSMAMGLVGGFASAVIRRPLLLYGDVSLY